MATACLDGDGAAAARTVDRDGAREPSAQAPPQWVDGNGLTESGRAALETLADAEGDGLPRERYWSGELRSALSEDTVLAKVETEIDRALSLLARDLANGLVASTSYDPGWQIDSVDHVVVLGDTAAGRVILDHVGSLRPSADQYERLRKLLADLGEIRDSSGWRRVDAGDAVLSEGARAPVVAQLRARLQGSISAEERRLAAMGESQPQHFDADLRQAVELFQQRHDVARDGILGPETTESLNVPVEERIAQVELALERWRWLPAELGSLAVVVNIAGRRVHVVEDGEEIMSMRAVVGERDWATAIFQDEMEELVLNPFWNIPDGIMSREILPRVLQDSAYLTRSDLEIVDLTYDSVLPLDSVARSPEAPLAERLGVDSLRVDTTRAEAPSGAEARERSLRVDTIASGDWDYRFRQRPGPQNPLGRVKFLFPNDYDIYLHDTPADHLFDERARTFSHGCIRLERPFELAHLLVERASEITGAQLDSLLATGETHVVELDRHLPVYLIYQTVWVDERGVPTFMPDVYGRDAEERAALSEAGQLSGRSGGA